MDFMKKYQTRLKNEGKSIISAGKFSVFMRKLANFLIEWPRPDARVSSINDYSLLFCISR